MHDDGVEKSRDSTGPPGAADDASASPISFHDQALWNTLGTAASPEEFGNAWLVLQSRLLPGAVRGVLVMGPGASGPFQPVAHWPNRAEPGDTLSAAAELAISEQRGVVSGNEATDEHSPPADSWAVAYPVTVHGELRGVAAFEIEERPKTELRSVMRQLQWGAAWIELILLRAEGRIDRDVARRTSFALDLVAGASEQDRLQGACQTVVTECASRLDCDRVSIGFVRHGAVRVQALSHSASFGKRMNLIRALEAAMAEAVDQRALVLYPPAERDDFQISRCQEVLVREHGSDAVLSVPFGSVHAIQGAMTFERTGGSFSPVEVELFESAACVVGPVLEEKRKNDAWIVEKIWQSFITQASRLIGPRYAGRKLVLGILVVLAVFFSVATARYNVNAPATVEGEVRRAIVAPFDGYVLSESARAGDEVSRGEPLAVLDDSDLRLERVRWTTLRREYALEYDRALAEGNRANANIARARMEQAEAQAELVESQINRARLESPFDGLVVSGDLSQSVGSTVQRGQVLFEVAPLQSYRVIIEVDENDIREVETGQRGTLLLSALPETPLPLVVERLTPVSEAREGRNFFRVEAKLANTTPRLRPGMEGIGKLDAGERKLIWIWTHRLVDWLRVRAWAYLPEW